MHKQFVKSLAAAAVIGASALSLQTANAWGGPGYGGSGGPGYGGWGGPGYGGYGGLVAAGAQGEE